MFSCPFCEDNFPSEDMCSQHLHNIHKWVQEKPFSCLGHHQGKAKRFRTEFLALKHELRCPHYRLQLDELGVPAIQYAKLPLTGDPQYMVKRLQGQQWMTRDDISLAARVVNSRQDAAAFIFPPADFSELNMCLFPARPWIIPFDKWDKH